ncbi:hypothetical protein [uncultured Ruegeria sp.]|uniref:hypothetical protein n=1 Tax=uncultured Ruegeria sp. TaxID=259304 RepID=UPI002633B50F|nr:hypothetical protein [uncultured Ruegeria sp.]
MSGDVEIKITLSRAAYQNAAKMAQDKDGIAGELAGTMSTEEFIERYLEILLEAKSDE